MRLKPLRLKNKEFFFSCLLFFIDYF
jgi:hypothetical protein